MRAHERAVVRGGASRATARRSEATRHARRTPAEEEKESARQASRSMVYRTRRDEASTASTASSTAMR